MKIQSMQNTKSFNDKTQASNGKVSFGSVKISRTFGDVFGVTIKADNLPDLVSFSDTKAGIDIEHFGKSMSAKALTNMINTLHERIANPDILNKVRRLASNVVDDVLPNLKKEYTTGEKTYGFHDNNNLQNLRTAIKKGTTVLAEDKKSLSIALNPDEGVITTATISRRELSELGIQQP